MTINIRFADAADIPQIMGFIRALSEYQHMEEEVTVTPELLEKWVFEQHMAEVLLAEADGEAVGFALYFPTYSAFPGLPGLYLQDLYIDPAKRGTGCGKALMAELSKIAVERGYQGVEWACLDWNHPSIQFYYALGAEPLPDWTNYRLSGPALHSLAEERP